MGKKSRKEPFATPLFACILKTQKWCIRFSKLCSPQIPTNFYSLRYGMRIKITKSLVLAAQMQETETIPEALFPAGEYLASLTPEGKIEVISAKKIKARFSFSQFREKVSLGEFVVVES